jgi:AAA15 family ATPase/GTPase
MILDFSIGNYRSFNKIQTLDFRATPLVSEDKTVDRNNIKESAGSGILKTIGLYGPNGSGKSNLVKGLRIFQLLVERSLESEAIMDFAADPFKLTSEQSEDAGFFQMQLLVEQKKYRYGFTLDSNGFVLQEWLFGPAEKNETWYFKRTRATVESNREWFEEGYNLPLDNMRINTLFLTFVSAYNGPIAQAIRSFIVKKISLEKPVPDSSYREFNRYGRWISTAILKELTNELVKEGKAELVLNWLKRAGLVYTGINIDEYGEGLERVLLEKAIFDKDGKSTGFTELDLDDHESAGTRKFYYNIGMLHQKFLEGGVLISDEIDNNFHPSLLQQFVRFFNDPTVNIAAAQLLFTSHDTNLMQPEILRRDQIYFTEKSVTDETILYSLADLKGIRNNADFARQYLAGFYGALPVLEKYKED